MKTDYGTSYFDALKKYVHLQKEFDAYKRKVQKQKLLIIGILAASCAVKLAIFFIQLFFN